MGAKGSLWEMVLAAGPMVKFVLLVLAAFSIISWAIIIYKVLLFRKVEKETDAFYDLFWEKRHFVQIAAAAKGFTNTPLTALFTAAYAELTTTAKAPDTGWIEPERLGKEDIERIQRILKKTEGAETARLEYAVPFLATAGNTAPFIGLFGTVWGIMTSFNAIGIKGAASIAAVAPGISEALIATAMGLMVAIPSVIGYNHLLARMDRITKEIASFSSDIINIMEKQSSKRRSIEQERTARHGHGREE